VLLSAWRGGFGPGTLASLLSSLALAYYVVEPFDSLSIRGLENLLRLAVFVFVAMLMGAGAAARRQAQHQEARLRAGLEERVRKRTVELENAMTQLRELAAGLEAAREEERMRLAREVHDVLGSALTGLKMDVTRLRRQFEAKSGPALALEAISAELDQAVQSTRRIASDLRPSALDDLGLAAAVEWQLDEFGRRTGLSTRLTAPLTDGEIDPTAATAVFRVFQEALTNVARHAQATQVLVELDWQPHALRLQVRDNGHGFDVHRAAQRRTLGLLGMRERIRLLSGHVVVHSHPDQGTRVDIYVPLNPAMRTLP
jgi:signal transduction histidine kinase